MIDVVSFDIVLSPLQDVELLFGNLVIPNLSFRSSTHLPVGGHFTDFLTSNPVVLVWV